MSAVATKKSKKTLKSKSEDKDVKTVRIDNSSFFLTSDQNTDNPEFEDNSMEESNNEYEAENTNESIDKKAQKLKHKEDENDKEGIDNEELSDDDGDNESEGNDSEKDGKKMEEVKINDEDVESPRHYITTTNSLNDSDTNSEVSSLDEEIIDIRQNTLYQVLACLLEDEKGDNLVEVLVKISDNLERHNKNLEKLVDKVGENNQDKLGERFDRQNKILAKISKSFDTYLNSQNNNNNNNNNNNE